MALRKHAEIKDLTESGEVEAVVATLGVVDKDGDVTEQGFFGEQTTKIVSSHDWSDILLGKGTVSDRDGRAAIFRGSLNLDDPKAEQLHAKLRYDMATPPPLIEWSYGFSIQPGGSRKDSHDGRDVRVLQPLPDGGPGSKVYEVSPVLVGAGEGTGTLAVKGATRSILEELAEQGDPDAAELVKQFALLDAEKEGQRFVEQIETTVRAVKSVLDRAEAISAARRNGRLGDDAVARLADLSVELRSLGETVDRVAVATPGEIHAEFLRFQAMVAGVDR